VKTAIIQSSYNSSRSSEYSVVMTVVEYGASKTSFRSCSNQDEREIAVADFVKEAEQMNMSLVHKDRRYDSYGNIFITWMFI